MKMTSAISGIAALCLGFGLVACSSNVKPSAPPFPTVVASASSRIIRPNQAPPLSRWIVFPRVRGNGIGQFALASGGPGGKADFELTGSGALPTEQLISPPVAVTPGRRYFFSAWVDGSKIAKGSTVFWLVSPAGTVIYAKALVPPGETGRYGFVANIPRGVTKVTLGFYTASCTLPKGLKIKFAEPMWGPVGPDAAVSLTPALTHTGQRSVGNQGRDAPGASRQGGNAMNWAMFAGLVVASVALLIFGLVRLRTAMPDGRLTLSGVVGLVRSIKPEYIVACSVFLLATAVLIGIKVNDVKTQWGDSAIYFQLTENLAHHGQATSQMYEAIQAYGFVDRFQALSAQEIATDPLIPSTTPTNPFGFHAIYIMVPLAMIATVLPADVVLLSADVIAFIGLLMALYLILRRRNISAVGAGLFCLLVVSSPAWWEGLLEGQFFPDRLFVLVGFLFMYLVYRNKSSMVALVSTGILCALINERGGLIAGIFLLAYVALYWKHCVNRTFSITLGAVLIGYSVLVARFAIVDVYNTSYLPTSLGQLVRHFQSAGFADKTGLMLLVNAALLAIALFEYRFAIIAALMMVPNIVGTIGGAEKIGWSTHYSCYYFPALVLAALAGFIKLYRIASSRGRVSWVYAITLALALFVGMIDPDSYAPPSISPAHLKTNFFSEAWSDMGRYLGSNGRELNAEVAELRQSVPEGSIVTTTESGMPLLYHHRTIEDFPASIDQANYALLAPVTSGAETTYCCADSNAKQDRVAIENAVMARMKRDGYDLDHPLLFPSLGLALVPRGPAMLR